MDLKTKNLAALFALLAAVLYAFNIPASKLLLAWVPPTMMAAFLYLGAGTGMLAWGMASKERFVKPERAELLYMVGMIVLDIAAPILLMCGLRYTGSANASLLNNFEIVATSAIAFFVFHEKISGRMVLSIALVTLASVTLSVEIDEIFSFHIGSVMVLLATCCWGLENNCTRMLSNRSSVQITAIKGIFSGFGSLIVAFFAGERLPGIFWILCVMLLGFVAYGLSINFYIKAQKELGAAKTSAYYSVAPFVGVIFGLLLGELPDWRFFVGCSLMIVATVLMTKDSISLQHTHIHSHTHDHIHAHGDLIHSHTHTHTHRHTHIHKEEEGEHDHTHDSIHGHDHTHKEET